MRFLACSMLAAVVSLSFAATPLTAQPPLVGKYGEGTLEVKIVDKKTGKPVPCRMHLKTAAGVPQQVPGLPFWKDHFVCPGQVTLKLKKGGYKFEIEAGPEYAICYGHFEINNFAVDEKTVEMTRIIDMASKGWWSGELHIHRPVKDIELLMLADDLHVAPVITWWNAKSEWAKTKLPENTVVRFDGNRYYDVMGGEDERGGGALLYFRLPRPLPITTAQREYPHSVKFLELAKHEPNAWVDIEKPFWWDVPVWLASERVDSIGIAHNHMWRLGVYKGKTANGDEAWGRPRDVKQYPPAWGNGQYTQDIYYHVLNCGLRIPPSAGSASGVLANPVGYNRMYVHVEPDKFNYETWWENLKLGRVVVTNGPLLEPMANNELPGHVFRGKTGQKLQFDVMLKNFATREKIAYLDLIRDGEVAASVSIDDFAKSGHFPPLEFEKSGWFLVRMVADNKTTYRFASTGPWYVEFDKTPRISKRSVQFFLDWLEERTKAVKLTNDDQQREVQQAFDAAKGYWQKLLGEANAE